MLHRQVLELGKKRSVRKKCLFATFVAGRPLPQMAREEGAHQIQKSSEEAHSRRPIEYGCY